MTDQHGTSSAQPLKDSVRARVGQIMDTWRRGSRPDARHVLQLHPELWSEPSAVLDLALAEFRIRRAAGEALNATEFAAQFSTYAEELRRILSVEQALPPFELDIRWPEPGEWFMEFELLQVLGVGAVGRVYVARQQTIGDRKVALKLTPFGFDEAHILGQLRHPNVVPILSVHRDEELRLSGVCMPYLGTGTLQDVVREAWRSADGARRRGTPGLDCLARAAQRATGVEPPETPAYELALWEMYTTYWDAITHLAVELCQGLAYTHGKGVLHLDLKPSNVLLSPKGRPMLLDFNLAVGPSGGGPRLGGTVPYMSPEQFHATFLEPQSARDANLGEKSDIYSLGVLLFELCTGRLPHEAHADDFAEYIQRMTQSHLRGAPPVRTLNPRVPEKLAECIDACLKTEINERPASVEQVQEALQSLIVHRTSAELRRKHRRVALATLAVLGGVVGLGRLCVWLWYEKRSHHQPATAVATDASSSSEQPHLSLEQSIEAALHAEKQGDFDRATQLFKKITKVDQSLIWREHLAYCLVNAASYKEARSHVQLLAAIEEENAQYQNNFGYVLMRLNDYRLATERFERAIQLDAGLFQPHFNLGICYLKQSVELSRAVECFERAIELAVENNYWLHVYAGRAYHLLEKLEQDPQYKARKEAHFAQASYLGCPRSLLTGFGWQNPDNNGLVNSQAVSTPMQEMAVPLYLQYCNPQLIRSNTR